MLGDPGGEAAVAAEWTIESMTQERRLSVLVVDPSVAATDRVRTALGEDYAVHLASTLAQALDAVRAQVPDLLVSEVDLSEGNGLQLCEQIRLLPEADQMPIMLLTERASIHDKVAGFQAGADDYVVKPFDVRLFHARIRLLCRIKGLEHPRREIGA